MWNSLSWRHSLEIAEALFITKRLHCMLLTGDTSSTGRSGTAARGVERRSWTVASLVAGDREEISGEAATLWNLSVFTHRIYDGYRRCPPSSAVCWQSNVLGQEITQPVRWPLFCHQRANAVEQSAWTASTTGHHHRIIQTIISGTTANYPNCQAVTFFNRCLFGSVRSAC